jgi:peptidoglycan/xylan/chitin deacetylase (PgdA/CDA1 family)
LPKVFLRNVVIILLILLVVTAYPEVAVAQEPRVPVLLYHHLIPEAPVGGIKNGAIITVEEFEAQMRALYERGYYTASLSELEDFVYGRGDLPKRSVVITFDDGYLSNYTLAYPILQRYGFKAAIFPIGSMIPEEDPVESGESLAHFSYGQMKAMAESGLIEFGNHTFDAHRIEGAIYGLVGLSAEEAARDLERFKESLKAKGIPFSPYIAYPMGRYDRKVIEVAQKTGHKLGFTVVDGFVRPGASPMTLNRMIVYPGTDVSKFLDAIGDKSKPLPQGFEESIVLPVGEKVAYIEGKAHRLEAAAILSVQRVMVPLRFVAEALGAKVIWLEDRVVVESKSGSLELSLSPDGEFQKEALVNGDAVALDTAPVIVEGTCLVPVRLLSEALGFDIIWHPDLHMVQLM